MTILVTGASGHVGANLTRVLLQKNRSVRVLQHRHNEAIADLAVETISGDVRDIESMLLACRNVDVVYHLAATISIEMGHWPDIEAVNVQGTRNIVEACLQTGVRRLVHFSSIHAFDQSPLDEILDESRSAVKPPCPPYDRSKAAGEIEVIKGINRGLNAVIIHPTAIVGPNDFQPSYFGQVILALAQGKLPGLVHGGFDWVDVRDVVGGAIAAEATAPPGARYLLSGHWGSLAEIARLVEKYSGRPAPAFTSPRWLALLGVPFIAFHARLTRQTPFYTRAAIKAVFSNKNISHQKATTELGYAPRDLEMTIRDTVRWFAENGRLAFK